MSYSLSAETSISKSPFVSLMYLPSRIVRKISGICATTANISRRPTLVITEPSMTPRGGMKKPPTMSPMLTAEVM